MLAALHIIVAPPCLEILSSNTPQELRTLRQWVLWKLVLRKGKWTKVPHNPRTGKMASPTNPEDWGTFDEVLRVLVEQSGYNGIGFVFTKHAGLAGIDLDNKSNDPELQIIHEKILADFPSYTERSPSGKGYHIIVQGEVPKGLNAGGVEIYSSGRYFTMTGNVVKNLPIADCRESLMRLWSEYKGSTSSPRKSQGGPKIITEESRPAAQTDEEVIARILKSEKCCEKFQSFGAGENRLLTGTDRSDSSVEWNLVRIITCFTQNFEQIDRLWLKQPIGKRDKTKNDARYRQLTIQKALEQYYANPYPEVHLIGLDRSESQVEGPQPLRRAMPPAERFPIEALGGLLSQAALAISDIVQCPEAMSGMSVLLAASLAVQAHADVVIPATGQPRPTSIFALAVADSGERKTTADGLALKAIRAFQDELLRSYELEKTSYENQMAAWKAERAKINGDKKTDFTAKKSALDALGAEPSAPLFPIMATDEPTYSGMCLLYEIGYPMLGIFSDEGGQFVCGHGMKDENKINTAAAISSLWDGKTINRVRRGEGPNILPGKRLSMHLMVQPNVASIFLSDGMLKAQGLLSRFLLCYPESSMGKRLQRPPKAESHATLNQYNEHLLAILRRKPALIPGTTNQLQPRQVMLEQSGVALWCAFADEIELENKKGGKYENISGFANKAAEHALCIAGVITLFEDINAQYIPAYNFERAVKLMRYFIAEALRLIDSGMVSPNIIKAELLLQWLHTKWDEDYIGTTVVMQHGPNSIRSKADAIAAIQTLVEHEWLIESPKPPIVNGKKVKKGWKIVRDAAANPANSASQENSSTSEISS